VPVATPPVVATLHLGRPAIPVTSNTPAPGLGATVMGHHGAPSILARAGVDVAGALLQPDEPTTDERRSVSQLLASQSQKGERYVHEQMIGQGGMGAVVRAVDCDIRREVAVKMMLNPNDVRMKSRFVEEAQITGQLEH